MRKFLGEVYDFISNVVIRGNLAVGKATTAVETLDVEGNIAVTGTVDTVDISSFKSSYDTHNHSLDSLSNVTITSNTDGEITRWNGSAWVNNTLAEAGINVWGNLTGDIADQTDLQDAFAAIAESGESVFFLENENDPVISGYKVMDNPAQLLTESFVTQNTIVEGGIVQEWITDVGLPGTTYIPGGAWTFHINAYKTGGTNSVYLYNTVYKRSSGGTETLLGTTGNSILLTGTEATIPALTVYLPEQVLLETDRIVTKTRMSLSGGGSDPTGITVGFSGSTAARLTLPAQALDITKLVRVTGDQTIDGVKTFNETIVGSIAGIANVLDSTTVGQNVVTLTNPGAISFLRVNANNTVDALDAPTFRAAIGAGTSSTLGTVTSVAAGNGLDFTTITATGSVTLGTPGTITGATTNSVTATSHTHAVTLTASDVGAAATSHTHGNITDAGAIGSTADLVAVTTTSGVLTTASRSGIDSRTTFPPETHTHAVLTAGTGLTSTGTYDGSTARTFSIGTTVATLTGSQALTNKTYNGLTLTTGTNTFTLTRGTATLVRSGAHALTLTTTAATNVTFPTSGTLATTAQIPTVNDATLTLNTSGVGLSGSQTFTANQSGAATFTVTSNATDANTVSTIVARDISGNFSAGTITAALSGNATTATTASATTAAATFNNGGTGAASGTTFDGSTARTISYNTIGAAASSHTHTTTDITNLSSYTGLDARYYTETEVDGFAVKLTGNQTISGIKSIEEVRAGASAEYIRLYESLGTNYINSVDAPLDIVTNVGSVTINTNTVWHAGNLTPGDYSLTTHNHTLDSLSNTTITSIASGELLKWNGSAWINNTIAEAGLAAASHNHSATNITSGTLAVDRGGTGLASYTTGNYIYASGTTTLAQRTPAQVLSDIDAVSLGTTQIITGAKNYTNTQTLDNNVQIRGKESGGTERNLVYVDSINRVGLGDTALPSIIQSSITPTYHDGTNTYDIYHEGNASPVKWGETTGTTQTIATGSGYIANNASRVIFSLPVAAPVGSVTRVTGIGAGGWRVSQGAGQVVYFGNTNTTSGATGYVESTHQRDSVELVCVVANTTWQVVSSVGNIEVV